MHKPPALLILSFSTLWLLSSACVYKRIPTESSYNVLDRVNSDRAEGESLFKGDAEVLSDQDIVRILSIHLNLEDRRRVAVLRLARTTYWSEDHATLEAQNLTSFLDRLRTARGVHEARELPALLVPDKKTVPYLREAAARFQADLLVAYDTRIETFSKYRFLGKDQAKAVCTVEAVLLDVRTGIIPFSVRASAEISAVKHPEEINFSEAVAKTTAVAEGQALQKAADELLGFLQGHGDT